MYMLSAPFQNDHFGTQMDASAKGRVPASARLHPIGAAGAVRIRVGSFDSQKTSFNSY
jgi:hypothetical protein